MNITTWITDPALTGLLGTVLVLFVVDFLTGVFAAVRNNTFSVPEIEAILRSQGTQVLFIIVTAVLSGGLSTPLGAIAAGAALAYDASTLASIKDNAGELLNPSDVVAAKQRATKNL